MLVSSELALEFANRVLACRSISRLPVPDWCETSPGYCCSEDSTKRVGGNIQRRSRVSIRETRFNNLKDEGELALVSEQRYSHLVSDPEDYSRPGVPRENSRDMPRFSWMNARTRISFCAILFALSSPYVSSISCLSSHELSQNLSPRISHFLW